MVKLRHYQVDSITKIKDQLIKGVRRILLCAPTGAGKTVIFSEITRMSVSKLNKVLILTHRTQLLTQTHNSIERFGITPEILTAYKKTIPVSTVVVAMIETIKRRLNKDEYKAFLTSFNVVIIDECHLSNFNKVFEVFDDKQTIIGVSATPFRDGNMKALSESYQKIVTVCQINELIDQGFLAKPKYFGVPIDLKNVRITAGDYNEKDLGQVYEDKKLFSGAVDNYITHTPNTKAIVFCATIQNSKTICEEFNQKGIKCEHFDCYMSDQDKENILSRYYANEFDVLCNVGILTTGFDCPDIETIILYRATKSLPLFLQMVGRGSRVTENKKDFTILDFGNNCIEHGFWHEDRIWSLDKKEKKKRSKKDVAPVKFCPECGAILAVSVRNCEFCGYEYQTKEKEREFIILEILNDQQKKKELFDTVKNNEASIDDLMLFSEIKGYKSNWIWYQLKTLDQFIEYGKIKGYKKGWAYRQFRERSQNSSSMLSDVSQ